MNTHALHRGSFRRLSTPSWLTAIALLSLVATGCSSGADTAAIAVTNPNTGDVSDELTPQDDALNVYEEHIRVLNDCDWVGLMAQYPDDAEIHLPKGQVVQGREAIGELFAGFVSAREDEGLCGLTFTEQSQFQVGDTLSVKWEADAAFLAEPYTGSDAYVSDGAYMVAMVSTFNGEDLVFVP